MAIKKGLTKKLEAAGVVSTAGKSALVHAITYVSGTAAGYISLLDGGSGGNERWCISYNATAAAGDVCKSISFPIPLLFSVDCYGALAGEGASAYILYDEIED